MLELEVNSNFCFFKKEIEIEISMMLEISGYMDLFLWNLPATNGW